MSKIEITVPIRCEGRYRTIVHTGHEFDEFGNVVKFGDVLRETPFGKNIITLTGFSKILQGGGSSLAMVAGSGNTTPVEGDTTLVAYLGKSATVVSQTTTRNVSPDVNNEVWWRVTYRVSFAPGSLGSGAVNVAEAGSSISVAIGSITSATPLISRGLLVDGAGVPTTVSLDATNEFLDIIWEYTEWVKASVTGSVNLTIDGTVTAHNYEVRPYYFDNTGGSFNYWGWADAAASTVPGYSVVNAKSGYPFAASTCAFAGPLGVITGNSLGNAVALNVPTLMTTNAYVTNSKNRTLRTSWIPNEANIAGGVGVIRPNLGHAQFQVSLTPKIAKIDTKQLDLYWTYAMANR